MVMERVILGERIEAGAKHAVNIEHLQGVGVIGLGPITGFITRAWVEYGGEEVNEVPEGENFTLKVSFTAQNPGFTWTPLDPGWSTAITAISTDGKVKGGDPTLQLGASQSETAAASLGPMPANDITLRVQLWGNQDIWSMPGVPDLPPENEW
ncbi:hypothetical protein ES705_37872 [subsurface metagenome]